MSTLGDLKDRRAKILENLKQKLPGPIRASLLNELKGLDVRIDNWPKAQEANTPQ